MQKYAKICKNMQKICKKYAVLGGSMFLYICAKYALGTLLMSGTLVRRWVRLGGSNSELPRSVSVTVVARLRLSSESRQGLLPTAFWWLASRSGWDRQARRGGTRMALNLKLNVRSLSRRSAKRVQFATRDRTALLRCHSFWFFLLQGFHACIARRDKLMRSRAVLRSEHLRSGMRFIVIQHLADVRIQMKWYFSPALRLFYV